MISFTSRRETTDSMLALSTKKGRATEDPAFVLLSSNRELPWDLFLNDRERNRPRNTPRVVVYGYLNE
ncbi:MAG TPA: hypothetical protein VEM15_04345, partial [Thermodesulfobacteriota bacterium]|nr:hypothetical protein [Thermodesulfobacteriota bacterium]